MAYIFTIEELKAYNLDNYQVSQKYHHGWLWIHSQTKEKLFIVNGILQQLGYINQPTEAQAIRIGQKSTHRRRKHAQTVSKSDMDFNWRHDHQPESTSAPETYTLLNYQPK